MAQKKCPRCKKYIMIGNDAHAFPPLDVVDLKCPHCGVTLRFHQFVQVEYEITNPNYSPSGGMLKSWDEELGNIDF